MLMICAAFPALAAGTRLAPASGNAVDSQTPRSVDREGWALQWSHNYGGNGHSQLAQPVGDLDDDGVNEVIVGGYESNGICRILSYVGGTYVQEYSWAVSGGSYHAPSGACIADLDGDGTLELMVSWAYSGADGVYAYHWDGTTLTQLDYYYGTGVDFIFDIYSCDYNFDGSPEVLIANAPDMGTGPYTVTGLQWIGGHFHRQASWTCPTSQSECPMVWSGDVDDDGALEVVADVASGGTWSLSWNSGTTSWDAVPVWTSYGSNTVYGIGIGDIDGDHTPEIGTGTNDGTPTAFLFEWDGDAFQKVWQQSWSGAEPIIEAIAIGDADNDGHNELCVGGGNVHVIGWNGTGYAIEATFTESTGEEAGMNICDFDTDGLNEVKTCEILSATGYEYIWKYTDQTPPVTVCTLDGTMDGTVYISNVTVTLTATDAGSGVDYTMIKVDNESWSQYGSSVIVTDDGNHVISYYSVDKMGNVEATKQTPFTIWRHPLFDIKLKGGIGVTMKVTNVGVSNQTMLSWTIAVNGGLILRGEGKSGTITMLAPGETVNEKLTVVGFGKTTVTGSVGAYTQNATGFMFLFFVLGVK